MPTRVWVVPSPEWKVAAAQLAVVENSLPRWIEEQIDEAIDPVVARAKAAVMSVDVQGGPTRSTGLRNRVAAGVGVRKGIATKGNSYFRIYTEMANVAESPIPRGLDSPKGWRHPLYGNKNYWFTSRPTRPGWFTDTIADSADSIERAIADALDRAERLAG
jgi:flavin-binding protein dodecin